MNTNKETLEDSTGSRNSPWIKNAAQAAARAAIIPTRGTRGTIAGRDVVLAAHCLRSLTSTLTYRNVELIVVSSVFAPVSVIFGDTGFIFSFT